MFGVFLWVVRWCGCLAPLTYIERWFRFDAKAGDPWKGVDSLGGLGGIGTILLWICVSKFVCVCVFMGGQKTHQHDTFGGKLCRESVTTGSRHEKVI